MKLRRWLSLLAVLASIVWSQSAFATHFRYGNITWTRDTVNPQLVHFVVQQAWRSDFLDCNELNFGDGGNSINACAGVTTVGTGIDTNGSAYTVRQYTTQHIYVGAGPFTAFFSGCCRVSNLQNGADANYRVETIVALGSGNTGGPVSAAPAIIALQTNGVRTYTFPMSDPDLDPTTCRLATTAEVGFPNPTPTIPGPLNAQPTVMTSPTGCVLTWDTTNAAAGQVYVVHYVVESTHGGITSSTQVDLIVQMVTSPPPTCTGGGTFIVPVGTPFSTMVTGTSSGNLLFGATGAPMGSTFAPASGTTQMSPFTTTFNWTPGATAFGQTVSVLASFTNGVNATGSCTITIQVPLCNESGQACSVGVGACQSSGQNVCTGPGVFVCNAVAGMPTMEICGNAVDEDCSGAIDNGCIDTDMDGIFDTVEVLIGTDPNDADSDDDGLIDGLEPSVGLDSDGDGLINGLDPDSDNDGLYDGTETGKNCSNPATNAAAGHCVADADPSTTTDPLDADTDNGGVSDGSEDANLDGKVDAGETDPTTGHGADDSTVVDTDGDGLSDKLENFLHSNPNDADTDDDGIIDGEEANFADDTDGDGLINVLDVDSDDDGLYDGTETGRDCANPATNAAAGHCKADADGGATKTSMVDPDTDNGGVKDGAEDANHNGTIDPGEGDPTAGHGGDDATLIDTDGDGLTDLEEMAIGSNPNDADSDDDGVPDGLEANYGDDTDGDGLINVLDRDSDGDGLFDGTELGFDCSNPATDTTKMNCVADADDGATVTSMVNPDTDFGGVKDGVEDPNHNGAIDAGRKDPLDPTDDDPCLMDSDCGGPMSGIVCNEATSQCQDGCRGMGGNGCPTGEECTSMDMTIGDCVPVMSTTSSTTGSMSTGSMSTGSMSTGSMSTGSMSTGTSTGGAGGGGSGGAGAYVQGHGIFGCSVSTNVDDGDASTALAALGLVGLGLVVRKRRRAA